MALLHVGSGRSRLRHLSSITIAVASLCLGVAVASSAVATTFNPALVISDDNMRAYDSMSQSDIQAFLETQKGPLKSLVTTQHAGGKDNASPSTVKKQASVLIWEACQAWHVSPRTVLTLLQKEQSLLTRTTLEKNTLNRAIGAGCPGGPTNHYPGFGSQMWFGARLLDGYGEGKNGSTITLWKAPYTTVMDIYQHPNVSVKTANVSTYKLYIYNPSIGAKAPYGDLSSQSSNLSGNANFWMIYRRNFGDTFANPGARPVYRFHNAKTGSYLYTASQAERYRLSSNKSVKSEGKAFSWNATATPSELPVYRFYNRKSHQYRYTASAGIYRWLITKKMAATWRYEGVAFTGTAVASGTTAVYQFTNKKTGSQFLTTSPKQRDQYRTKKYRATWASKGIPFHLAK